MSAQPSYGSRQTLDLQKTDLLMLRGLTDKEENQAERQRNRKQGCQAAAGFRMNWQGHRRKKEQTPESADQPPVYKLEIRETSPSSYSLREAVWQACAGFEGEEAGGDAC